MERTRKWSRRHPSVVIAGLVILLPHSALWWVWESTTGLIAQEQAKTAGGQLQHEKGDQGDMEARRAVGDLVEIAGSELADQPQLEAACVNGCCEPALA